MKIIIMSDSHGNIANLKHVMGFAEKIKAGGIIHCGDWNNIEAIKAVIEYKIPLYSVLGNADIDPKIEESLSKQSKKFTQIFLLINLGGKKMGVVHDLAMNDELLATGCDIIFYGHTHKQMGKMVGMVRMVNPGALERGISFAVYDTDSNKVELINDKGRRTSKNKK